MNPSWRGLAVASLCWLPTLAAAGDEDVFVAVVAGSVITVSGEEYSPGTIVIRNGRIEAVGKRVEVPPQARVIDAEHEVVMPGFVNPRSRFGLSDYDRTGNHADLRASAELFARPGEYRPLLEAGFVAVGLIPGGSGIPGTSDVIRPRLSAPVRPHEPATLASVLLGEGYLRITMAALPADKQTLSAAFQAAKEAIAREEKARAAWEAKQKKEAAEAATKAKEAGEKKPDPEKPGAKSPAPPGKEGEKPEAKKPPEFEPPAIPPALKPFVAILRKQADAIPRILVELHQASDLLHFQYSFGKHGLKPAFFVMNQSEWRGRILLESDFFHVIDALATGEQGASAPVVVIYPQLTSEPFTKTQRSLPAELARAGAAVAFVPLRDDQGGHTELRAAVAELVRSGLSRDVALRALTSVPAGLLGLGDDLGSLEKGRRADLAFLSGDPFEAGSKVTRVMLDGELVGADR